MDMRFGAVCAFLASTTIAFGGIPGQAVQNFTVVNNSGSTANDLHVSIGVNVGPSTAQSSTFATTVMGGGTVDFSNGTVAPGASALFQLFSTVGTSYQTVSQYNWTVDGSQVGSTVLPLYLEFTDPNPNLVRMQVVSTEAAAHTFDSLFVTQNGGSLLSVPASGSLGGNGSLVVTSDIDVHAGQVQFGFRDTTAGLQLSGTFDATVPEPAAIGLCAFGLLGLSAVAAQRKRTRAS